MQSLTFTILTSSRKGFVIDELMARQPCADNYTLTLFHGSQTLELKQNKITEVQYL